MSRPTRPDVLVAKTFDESKVKRDERGRFAEKASSGVPESPEVAQQKPPEKLGTYRKRGGRPGGDKRGNTTDRRRRKEWMLKTFGDGESCPCTHCDVPLNYETVESDRIDPNQGYARKNVQPSCRGCNLSRSDVVEWMAPKELANKVREEEGYTYDKHENRFATEGFALSVFPAHEVVVDLDENLGQHIRDYVQEHWDMVKQDERIFYGAWWDKDDTGKVFLDLSIVVDSAEEAERLSHEYEQEAYFDLSTKTPVNVGARAARVSKRHRGQLLFLGRP